MLKPTSYLAFTLNEDDYSDERAASLVRSYSYVSPTSVAKGSTNTVDLRVKLKAHPFWNANDPEEQSTWQGIVAPWLSNKLSKLGQTITEYNNEKARSYCGSIAYDSIILRLDPVSIECRIAKDEDIEIIASSIEALRNELAAKRIDVNTVDRVLISPPERSTNDDEDSLSSVVSLSLKDSSSISFSLAL